MKQGSNAKVLTSAEKLGLFQSPAEARDLPDSGLLGDLEASCTRLIA